MLALCRKSTAKGDAKAEAKAHGSAHTKPAPQLPQAADQAVAVSSRAVGRAKPTPTHARRLQQRGALFGAPLSSGVSSGAREQHSSKQSSGTMGRGRKHAAGGEKGARGGARTGTDDAPPPHPSDAAGVRADSIKADVRMLCRAPTPLVVDVDSADGNDDRSARFHTWYVPEPTQPEDQPEAASEARESARGGERIDELSGTEALDCHGADGARDAAHASREACICHSPDPFICPCCWRPRGVARFDALPVSLSPRYCLQRAT
jgi:hypothetical protein